MNRAQQRTNLRRRIAVSLVASLVVATLATYGGVAAASGANSRASKVGGTLTVAALFPNQSLNPGLANTGTDVYYLDPVYASLIVAGPKNTYLPDLATKWGYVGPNNRVFDVSLRAGVKFSDGAKLTATAVIASLRYFEANNTNRSWIDMCNSFKALNALTVRITCSTPNPELPFLLSDWYEGGDVMCPAALSHPTTLATSPCGAGPYRLDKAETITGSAYTYVPNPKYWDPSAIHYHKIVVKFFPDTSTALAALQAGQVNIIYSINTEVDTTAAAEGVSLSGTPLVYQGVDFADRIPGASNPFGNVLVRQALNYAIDRPAIIKAIYGKYGTVDDQVGIASQPTTWSSSLNSYYTYNPTKAKQLLAQAGYPNGFSTKLVVNAQNGTAIEAIVGYWEAIGVKVNVTLDPTNSVYDSDALSKNFPIIGAGAAATAMFTQAQTYVEPTVNPYNPFGLTSTAALKLLAKAERASGAKQVALYQAVDKYMVQNAWWCIADAFEVVQMLGKGVSSPPLSTGIYIGSPTDASPAS